MNTFPNEENYNETPITCRSEFFRNNKKDYYSDYDEHTINIIHDAYCVGINDSWVENHLQINDYVNIYKSIIAFARREIVSASEKYDKAWEEQATNILHFYQGALLTTLTEDIRSYCMNI